MLEHSQQVATYYGETQVAVRGRLWQVGEGEVVALLGPNGAGKTTTIRSILGPDARPTRRHRSASTAMDITRKADPRDRPHAGVGWVPDDRRIFPTLTVARNLGNRHETHPSFRSLASWTRCSRSSRALEYLMNREGMREPLRR